LDVYSRNWTLEIAKFEEKIEEKPEKTTLEEKYIDGDRNGERGRERENGEQMSTMIRMFWLIPNDYSRCLISIV